jgi:hypothetical protein
VVLFSTAIIGLGLTGKLGAAGTPTPGKMETRQPQTTGADRPLKPNYSLALIQLTGVFGALAFVVWMERRRR